MARKADLQAELDALGIDYKAKDTIAVLEAKLAGAASEAEGVTEDPDPRQDEVFAVVQGPPSWANTQWSPAFLSTPLRFNRHGNAQLLIETGGKPVVFEFMGPNGIEQVPIADKVAEHPDLEVTA